MSVTVTQLPKYIEEANLVLATLAAVDGGTWTRTQRDLADELGLPQPIVSLRLKLLMEQGRIRKGNPLPMRGRNHALVVVDSTPLDESVRSQRSHQRLRHEDADRVLSEEEEATTVSPARVVRLDDFTPEMVGNVILQTVRDMWEREEQSRLLQTQQNEAMRQFRMVIAESQRTIRELQEQKNSTEERLNALEREKTELRRTLNQLIVTVNQRRNGSQRGTASVAELLDDESLKILNNLIQEKPGDYRTRAQG